MSVLNVSFKRHLQVGEVGGQDGGNAAGAHHGREQGCQQGLQHVQLLRRLQVRGGDEKNINNLTFLFRCGVVGGGGLKVFIYPPAVWTKPSGDEVNTHRL